MEYKSVGVLHGTDEISTRNEQTESSFKDDVKDVSVPPPRVDSKDGEKGSHNVLVDKDMSGEINMEASIASDDIIRAGGFGARDDIGSFLPVASDATDFEATILDAKDYEEQQGETRRPGLGWSEVAERK